MKSYSQIGQDIFVQKLIGNLGYFVEIGGHLPDEINNTFMLENIGWSGISFDIVDYRKKWEIRRTPLFVENCVTCDFIKIFNDKSVPSVVDYLSVDVELEGERYKSLLNCWKANRKFKIITIEHDSHVGFSESEKKPQREFLTSQGYFLLFGDVTNKEGASYEDWWINPEFFNMDDLIGMKSEGEYWVNIIEKIKMI